MRLTIRVASKTVTALHSLIDHWWERKTCYMQDRVAEEQGTPKRVEPVAWKWDGLELYREGELVLQLAQDVEDAPGNFYVTTITAPYERSSVWAPMLAHASEITYEPSDIDRFVQAVWPNEGAPKMPVGEDAVGGAGVPFTVTPGHTDPTVRSASWKRWDDELRLVECDDSRILLTVKPLGGGFTILSWDTTRDDPPSDMLSADALDAYVAKAWGGWSIPPVPRAKVTKPSLWSWAHANGTYVLWETAGGSPLKRVSVEKCHGSVERWAIRFNGNGAPDFANGVEHVNFMVQLRYPEAPPLPFVKPIEEPSNWHWTTEGTTHVLWERKEGYASRMAEISVTETEVGLRWRARCGGHDPGESFKDDVGARAYVIRRFPKAPPMPSAPIPFTAPTPEGLHWRGSKAMKAHVLTVVVIDFEDQGLDACILELEAGHFGNDCIAPRVREMRSVDIGEWDDDHPLNIAGTDVLAWLAAREARG